MVGDNSITLIHGDCLEEMKKMPDKSVDLILTDPPYGVRKKEKWDAKKYFIDNIQKWLKECFRLSEIVIWFCAGKMMSYIISECDNFHRLLIWNKPPGTQFAGAMHNNLWYSMEPILIFGNEEIIKMKGKKNQQIGYSVWNDNTVPFAKFNHPTSKPEQLMKWLCLHYSDENDIILDPFMGSGTTGVACAKLHRRFIGIEIDKQYYDVACKRIKNVNATFNF